MVVVECRGYSGGWRRTRIGIHPREIDQLLENLHLKRSRRNSNADEQAAGTMSDHVNQFGNVRVDGEPERSTAVGGDMREPLAMAARHCGDAGRMRELRNDLGGVNK